MTEACICTIGDEILIGQIVDSNSAYISRELNKIGIKVSGIVSIGDDFSVIINTISNLIEKHQIVIVTGGLGPTKDDITKKALYHISDSDKMVYSAKQLSIIEDICNRRGIEVSQLNREQSLVPDKAIVLLNRLGTAPGMMFKVGGNKLLFSLPGVPYEMEAIMPQIEDIITKECKPDFIYHKTLVTYGLTESVLATILDEWENSIPKEIKLAYLPNPAFGIKLRLSVYNGDKESSIKRIDSLAGELKEILGDIVYGEDNDNLERVIFKVFKKGERTLSFAESCTGGRLSSLITSIPGSSSIYKGGVNTYSNESKISLLSVKKETIEEFGAVSRECAQEMAISAKSLFKSDYSLATTGIAGPTGGSVDKPVGTVWIAIAGNNEVYSRKFIATGDRQRNIIRFASEALNYLRIVYYKENQSI